jgi:hypothetical protein
LTTQADGIPPVAPDGRLPHSPFSQRRTVRSPTTSSLEATHPLVVVQAHIPLALIPPISLGRATITAGHCRTEDREAAGRENGQASSRPAWATSPASSSSLATEGNDLRAPVPDGLVARRGLQRRRKRPVGQAVSDQ